MIAKRIRRGVRAPRGSVRDLHGFVTALTGYLIDANAADLVEIETGRRLTEYVLDSRARTKLESLGIEPGEKVIHAGTRNLTGDSLQTWQAQMLAVAVRAARCRDPIEHYVLSWQSGEQPNEEQFARAVELTLAELGMSDCQAVWSVHGNTANLHAHIAVNRVHPVTGKAVSAGDGWDKDRLQQVCALIEHEGGWRAEENATYVVRDDTVVHRETDTVVRDREGRQTRARDRANEPLSFPEIFEPIPGAIAAARDWRDLHDRMRRLDARFERAGPGANVIRAGTRIKPSKLGRDCSLSALQKRFGPFEPSRHLDGYDRYRADRIAQRDRLSAAKNAAISAVENWYSAQASGLAGGAMSEFVEMLLADLGARRAAILSSIEFAFTSAEAATGAVESERAWIAAGRPDASPAPVPAVILPSPSTTAKLSGPPLELLGSYSKRLNASTGITEFLTATNRVAAADAGSAIIVYSDRQSDIEAGLALTAQRWTDIRFTGSTDAAEIVIELARLHGVRVFGEDGRRLLPNVGRTSEPAAEIAHPGSIQTLPADRDQSSTRSKPPIDIDAASALDLEDPAAAQSQIEPSADDGPDVVGHIARQRGGTGR